MGCQRETPTFLAEFRSNLGRQRLTNAISSLISTGGYGGYGGYGRYGRGLYGAYGGYGKIP